MATFGDQDDLMVEQRIRCDLRLRGVRLAIMPLVETDG
jgi:hypothetical protein